MKTPKRQSVDSIGAATGSSSVKRKDSSDMLTIEKKKRSSLLEEKRQFEKEIVKYQKKLNSMKEFKDFGRGEQDLQKQKEVNQQLRQQFLHQMAGVRDHLKVFRQEVVQSQDLMQHEMENFVKSSVAPLAQQLRELDSREEELETENKLLH